MPSQAYKTSDFLILMICLPILVAAYAAHVGLSMVGFYPEGPDQ